MEKYTIVVENQEGVLSYVIYEVPGIEYAYTKARACLPEGCTLMGVINWSCLSQNWGSPEGKYATLVTL